MRTVLLCALVVAGCGQEVVGRAGLPDAAPDPRKVCANDIVDGEETDIDCGGSLCAGCDTSQRCRFPADCRSGVCQNDRCAAARCGDGVLNGDDRCDDGLATASCDADCSPVECGDGVLNTFGGEQCDDGGRLDGDGCGANCRLEDACGNGVIDRDVGEVCDDGDTNPGDGCSADCRSDESCGNGVVDRPVGEACDDGDTTGDATCAGDCTIAPAFAVGGATSCAVLASGRVRCWGEPVFGQLGYGTTATVGDDEVPARAPALLFTATPRSIACGFHTCARFDDGGVRCWGRNHRGQLGTGTTAAIGDDEPASMLPPIELGGRAVQIVVGSAHTCALLEGGAVRCWGDNARGQLGYADTAVVGDDETPAAAGDVELGGVAVELVAGGAHTCARLTTGAVRCWGDNSRGQLGYANTLTVGDDETPATAGDVDVGGAVRQLTAGTAHTCAVLLLGTVRCWGDNSRGQLGYANTLTVGDDEVPRLAGPVSLGGVAVELAAGDAHTCARLTTGDVRCWGANARGQLGYANTLTIGDDEAPATAGPVELGGTAVRLVAGPGANHTCAVLAGDALQCWGDNASGQLGYATTVPIGDDEHPASAGGVAYR